MKSTNQKSSRVARSARGLLFGVTCLVAVACSGGETAREAIEGSLTETGEAPEVQEPLPEIDETPTTPIGLVVVGNAEGTVDLQWDESRDETVTGYIVTRVASVGGDEVFETTEPSFTDSGLTDGDIFTYSVAAIGDGGTSLGSDPVSVQVGVDTNPPSRPGTPRTEESTDGVQLTWRASTDFSGIDGYVITRILDGETTEIDVEEANFFDDLAPGNVVSYSVRAVDAAGNESDDSRIVTLLSGTSADDVIVVVSAIADPAADANSTRLQNALLEAGYRVSWFEDDVFDSNVTTSDDLVLLVGDVQGQGFDWNLFGTNAHTIALKSIFLQASGILVDLPKLDGLAQLDYAPPGEEVREVTMTTTDRPRNVVIIPQLEQLPDLQVWATPTWTDEIAVAGLIPTGGELANDRGAPGCRAFFPGNNDALAEQTDAAWQLLIEFVDSVSTTCR